MVLCQRNGDDDHGDTETARKDKTRQAQNVTTLHCTRGMVSVRGIEIVRVEVGSAHTSCNVQYQQFSRNRPWSADLMDETK